MTERILLIGDTTNISSRDLCPFVRTVHCLYGGSFPIRKAGLPDTIIEEKTRRLLAEVGISDPSPLVVCDSDQERAEQILQVCSSRRKQRGEGLYLVIDQNPNSLAEAVKSVVASSDGYQSGILQSITVINLGAEQGSDCVDNETGLRVTSLPYPLNPFPAHPTPAS